MDSETSDIPRGQARVTLGLGDWSSVLYALGRFAFLHPDDEERKLPKDRALFLLRKVDEQVEATKNVG